MSITVMLVLMKIAAKQLNNAPENI